ncbi:MAG: mechanosensitive ion channel family protein [Legionellales bacterium]|nr:mechanosensitive ion channel family protein [Legionellales bacterium]
MIADLPHHITSFFNWQQIKPYLFAIITLIVGVFIAKFVSRGVAHALKKHASAQQIMVSTRLTFYLILFLFIFAALQQIGFKLSVLLSAAGVLTIAVSFASQTAFSNIISGIFLIIEKPFKIGDTITVTNLTGEVIAIDLLSIKLRTSDNTLVRLANEQILKTGIINLSYFPTRRCDIPLRVSYKTDLNQAFDYCYEAARNNALILKNPAPTIAIVNFGEIGIELLFSVWCMSDKLGDVKRSLQIELKSILQEHQIDIPYPHRTIEIIQHQPQN